MSTGIGAAPTFGFTGELQQGGDVYLRARWYSTAQGRFGSVDPAAGAAEQPYSFHPYQYAYSAPTVWSDPSGRCVASEGRNGCYGEQSFGAQIIAIMRAYNLYPDAFNSLTPGNPQMAAAVWRLMDRHPAQAQTYDPRQDPELSTLIAQEYYGDSAEVVLQILQMVTAWQLDHTNNSTTPWTYAVGVIGTVGITDGPAGFCSPDRGGGGGGGYGRANNLKGKGFENLVESQFSRQGRNVFYRGRTWGADGFDLVSLEGGTIVLNEAKFQNTTRFDDFTAITRNLKTNIRDVLDRVRGSSSLNTDEQRLVIQTLEMFLEDGITPPNLKIRVISGKGDPIGLRIRARLGRSTGGIPIEYEDFKK